MITKDNIDKAQKHIEDLIKEQTQRGEQTNIVKKINSSLYSLGQFIEDFDRNQRGIHGTAAGLRVLATNDQNRELVIGLTTYLRQRESVENQILEETEKINDDKVARDYTNIIKLSEILYSLSFVKTGHIATDDFKQEIATKIESGQLNKGNNSGWDYYNDGHQEEISLLPSCFAVWRFPRMVVMSRWLKKPF